MVGVYKHEKLFCATQSHAATFGVDGRVALAKKVVFYIPQRTHKYISYLHLLSRWKKGRWTYGAWAARVGRLASATLDRVVDGCDGAQNVFETGKVIRGRDGGVIRGDVNHAIAADREEVRERDSTRPNGSHLAREECG